MRTVASVFIFRDGTVIACDESGDQIEDLNGDYEEKFQSIVAASNAKTIWYDNVTHKSATGTSGFLRESA